MNEHSAMKKKRVVVTGIGVITSIGIGNKAFWNALLKGATGISKIDAFDPAPYGRSFGGQIREFDPLDFMNSRQVKRTGRASQLAIAATDLAFKDAKVNVEKINKDRIATIIGTTMGEESVFGVVNKDWFEKGVDKIKEFMVSRTTSDLLSVNVGLHYGLSGVNWVIPTACAAGNYSIGYGYDLIHNGSVDMAIVGGADAFSRIAFTGFARLFAMSPDICSPFDKNRRGMLVGEGSGVLILESLENAQRTESPIYAELAGYGLSCDAHHMTIPSEDGIIRCIQNAITATGINPESVDYISAHGTGTVQNDLNESAAINRVFPSRAGKLPVSSIKSMLGHTMGAASAIEAASCCLAIKHKVLPPTINFKTPDPACNIDCVPNKPRKAEVGIALNNAFAFGGNNCCVVFKKYYG